MVNSILKNKKIIGTCIVLLLFGMALMPTLDSKIIDAENIEPFFKDKSQVPVIYIEASSPYEYGLKAGKLCRLQYMLINLFMGFTNKNKINVKDIKNEIHVMEQYNPFFLEELKGLSASLKIKLERLLLLQKLMCSAFDGACTTTLSTGRATKNNETFLTLDFDLRKNSVKKRIVFSIVRMYTHLCWVVKINTMKYKYAFLGMPIICEIPLLNEKGLGWGGNQMVLTKNESRYIDEGPGMSTYMLDRLTMMTCKNVSEVATLWKNTERSSGTYKSWPHQWDNAMSVWCDKEGGILMIEQTHNHILTVFRNSIEITSGPEDILWHANHHQWLNPNETGSVYPGECPKANCSYLRAIRARELLEENYGNITLDVCKNIVSDHGGGTDKNGKDACDICRHPDRNHSVSTVFACIIQPKHLTVYWTHRSPCRSRFIKQDFTEKFEK